VAELVESSCDRATQFAEQIATIEGCDVLNDVVLNQVLFRFDHDEPPHAVHAGLQASDAAWIAGNTSDGRAAIRLSVSNWRTSESDIDRTVAAFEAALVSV
jgi:glutamate/tyrosine decarboxylase-like PLP-dependent enzyme